MCPKQARTWWRVLFRRSQPEAIIRIRDAATSSGALSLAEGHRDVH